MIRVGISNNMQMTSKKGIIIKLEIIILTIGKLMHMNLRKISWVERLQFLNMIFM